MREVSQKIVGALNEITQHLEQGIIPFWLRNGIDNEYGGYLTCFDAKGIPSGDTNKYIVTQARMIWGFSALFHRAYPENKRLLEAARQGVRFLIEHFWDRIFGGWYWKVRRDGALIDDGKVVYGQAFAIYALAEYTRASGDPVGLQYAEKTFDLLQIYCADTYRGGYYENLEPDWTISPPGFSGGDRKSLDTHLHLLEAFTTLAEVSGREVHRRRLAEVIDIIVNRMIDPTTGCGLNQFDLAFTPIPAINIRRTWNAEREAGQTIDIPTDSTSYGHNLELAWLLNKTNGVLGRSPQHFAPIVRRLVDHSLQFGFDHELGGVFRDGPHSGQPFVFDKEWWQQCEALVGYLEAFERFGDDIYFEAFYKTWEFAKKYMINHEVGEWRQLVDRQGRIIVGTIGNPWKAIYHTGRSMLECKERLTRLAQGV